ncbi:MAG: bifunctional oligoribonuclease/PAP phosphatase NrnA [Calditrichota bacterium]
MTTNWQPTAACIEHARRIILTTHVGPDGDGIGSEIAFYHFLKQLGKSTHILNPSVTPREYTFLDPDGIIRMYDQNEHLSLIHNADLFIILDIGSLSRLQEIGEDIAVSRGKTLCIDHHPNVGQKFDCEIIDPDAAATGIMIYELMTKMDSGAIDFTIAQALYTAVMTDTGSFRFNNTTPETHQVAKELLEYGVKPYLVYRHVYESYSIERMKLLGKIIENLQFTDDRLIAYFPVTLEMQESVGAQPEDIEGFSDFIRSLGDIEVAVMFHEVSPGKTRVNFRSKGKVVINTVAKKFDGGGHKFAAGAIIEKPYQEAMPLVIQEVQRIVEEYMSDQPYEEAERAIS